MALSLLTNSQRVGLGWVAIEAYMKGRGFALLILFRKNEDRIEM